MMDAPSGGIEKLLNKSLLGTLKDYKEFIAILVFFIGGILWIFGYFATKKQLDELHCLMNANVDFIQGRMEAANLSQLMVQNIEELTPFANKTELSPDE